MIKMIMALFFVAFLLMTFWLMPRKDKMDTLGAIAETIGFLAVAAGILYLITLMF